MTEQQIDRERLSDHDRMNYWWRRATQAEARIKAVHDLLDRKDADLDAMSNPPRKYRGVLMTDVRRVLEGAA